MAEQEARWRIIQEEPTECGAVFYQILRPDGMSAHRVLADRVIHDLAGMVEKIERLECLQADDELNRVRATLAANAARGNIPSEIAEAATTVSEKVLAIIGWAGRMHNDVAALRVVADHARQLATIATDWNLDEVEIDKRMVRTSVLHEQFYQAGNEGYGQAELGRLRAFVEVMRNVASQDSCTCAVQGMPDDIEQDRENPSHHAMHCPKWYGAYAVSLLVGKSPADPDVIDNAARAEAAFQSAVAVPEARSLEPEADREAAEGDG